MHTYAQTHTYARSHARTQPRARPHARTNTYTHSREIKAQFGEVRMRAHLFVYLFVCI